MQPLEMGVQFILAGGEQAKVMSCLGGQSWLPTAREWNGGIGSPAFSQSQGNKHD
jgi:hypothetical protein